MTRRRSKVVGAAMRKGWRCKCGHENPFTMWVYAHWTIELIASCTKCTRRVFVKTGKIVGKVEDNA